MKVTTLVENSSQDDGLMAEHGLSLHISTEDRNLLFDMGASDLFVRNADRLDVDLGQVDAAVVSHAHYDHGGGLIHFLDINQKADVYLMSTADGAYYGNIGARLPLWLHGAVYPLVKRSLLFSRYIGLDQTLLHDHAHRLHKLEDDIRIGKGITILNGIGDEFPMAEGNKFLLQKSGEGLAPDRFDHELVMVVEEADGLVMFTGCGHGGLLNMVAAVRRAYPSQPIKAVVGGYHLALQPGRPAIAGKREDIVRIGDELIKLGVGKVYTGHCTGDEAYAILKEVLGEKLNRLSTGARFTL